MRPPPLPHQIALLERVLDRVATPAGGAPRLAVFDLDGTLYDNRTRTLQILRTYANEVRAEFPDLAAALDRLDASRVRYLLSDTLRGCGLTQVDVVRDVTQYWRARFFSDEFLAYDAVVPGAADYVRACHEAGATVVYLTGRDLPGMLVGTMASLRDQGFPLGAVGVEVLFKPDGTLADEAFKRVAMPALRRIGEVAAYFDNEPANCNVAAQFYPDAVIGLVDTQSVPGAPNPDGSVEFLSDFRRV